MKKKVSSAALLAAFFFALDFWNISQASATSLIGSTESVAKITSASMSNLAATPRSKKKTSNKAGWIPEAIAKSGKE